MTTYKTYTLDKCWDCDLHVIIEKINNNCGTIEKIFKKRYYDSGEMEIFIIWSFRDFSEDLK